MLILQDCVNKLTEFKRVFGSKFGILRLGIFGSVARKENSEDSDIDIVVDVANPSFAVMSKMRSLLQAIFEQEVDLVRYRQSLPPLLKQNIDKEAVYV